MSSVEIWLVAYRDADLVLQILTMLVSFLFYSKNNLL